MSYLYNLQMGEKKHKKWREDVGSHGIGYCRDPEQKPTFWYQQTIYFDLKVFVGCYI